MATAKGKAAAEVDALARALDMRGRELAKLKQLSAAVLQQRGDLETFLLSSIDMVHALALPSTRPPFRIHCISAAVNILLRFNITYVGAANIMYVCWQRVSLARISLCPQSDAVFNETYPHYSETQSFDSDT